MEIRYGLDSDKVSSELVDAIYEACLNLNEEIFVEDLKNCFNFTEIEKRKFQKITLDEFMTPVRDYLQKKQIARQAFIDLNLEQQKAEIEKNKETEFLQQAEQCYLLSLESKNWLGDMFQARVLVKPFWEALYKEEREYLTEMANIKIQEDKNRAILDPFVIVYDKLYYLAQETMIYAIKKGKKLIKQ
jgi:hypothetical protein